jgi:SAM-dependent methyltransferase
LSVRDAPIRWLAKPALLVSRLGAFLSAGLVGAMRREQRDRAIRAYWDEHAQASETLYEWESDFYLKHLAPGGHVLLFGCGAGRDLLGLARAGFRVDGLDIAPGAVAACRKRLEKLGIAARLYAAPVEDVRFETVYDAAVFTWQGYGLIPERAARIRSLQALRSALCPGGRILLTYLPAAGPSRGAQLAMLVSRLTASGWSPAPNDTIDLSSRSGELALYMEHRFTAAEVVAEAQAAALRVAWHEQGDFGSLVLER